MVLGMLGLSVVTAITASAQDDTELVQLHNQFGETEEFGVLKSNKTLRQGSYVKYRVVRGPSNSIALLETGKYERGYKEGEWRTFVRSPYNKLASKGSYHAGLPEGQWFYYHEPKPGVSGKAVPAGKNSKVSLTVDQEDSTAVVRAKGMCRQGKKVGLWKYYDAQATLVQAINESTNQLMYWASAVGQPVSGEIVTDNHPLLYVGGKAQLLLDLYDFIKAKSLLRNGADFLKDGQIVNTELLIPVDSLGHQTTLTLAHNKVPSKYEQFLLMQLSQQDVHWLPKVEHGKAVPADYRLLIVTQKFSADRMQLLINPLGD